MFSVFQQYIISQLYLVHSGLHLVTYFSAHINDDVTAIENNRQACINVHKEVFAISRIAERILTKLDGKGILTLLYQVRVFRLLYKNVVSVSSQVINGN